VPIFYNIETHSIYFTFSFRDIFHPILRRHLDFEAHIHQHLNQAFQVEHDYLQEGLNRIAYPAQVAATIKTMPLLGFPKITINL
jgi:hypothetical protein